jgi:multiple sugar transport system substrate-binding protein
MFVEVLAGYGGFWIDPDTQIVGLDQPEALQAVKFLRQSIAQGISPERVTIYGEEETRRLFQDGEVIFLRNWPEVWAIVNSVDSPIQGQIAIHPVPHAPNQQSHGCQGGWGLGIASTTSHPEAAWEAIRFFTSAASQRQFTLESGYLPSRTALYTDPQIVQRYPHYPALLSLFDQSVLRPAIPQYLDVSAILQRYLQAALNSQLSPEQAMQTAAQETRRLLAAPPSP